MDGFNEKKWFVYLGDHHEGPFSVADIQGKMQQGKVSGASYLWTEGMADWKAMSQIEAFSSLVHTRTNLTSIAGSGSGKEAASGRSSNISLVLEEPSTGSIAATIEVEVPTSQTSAQVAQRVSPVVSAADPLAMSADEAVAELMPHPAEWAQESSRNASPVFESPAAQAKARPGASSGIIKFVAFLSVMGGFGYAGMEGYLDPLIKNPIVGGTLQKVGDLVKPQLRLVQDYLPFVTEWISPIPKLEDVSEEDKQLLLQANFSSLAQDGPKVEVVASKADPLAPAFYISSNLPDQTNLELHVEGVPSTLLNQLSFSAKTSGKLQSGVAKTAAVRFADGKPIPKGEYLLYVYDSTAQVPEVQGALQGLPAPTQRQLPQFIPAGRKVLYKKQVFLGGIKDTQYMARLKEFHEKLAARATAEIAEVKQFQGTLAEQLSGSLQTFSKLKAGKLNRAREKMTVNNWNRFHQKWMKLNQQLSQTFSAWTPEILQRDYYYSPLYVTIQQAGQSIAQVHAIQDRFFKEKVDVKAFEVELGQAQAAAQAALAGLAAKITQAEQLGTTPNGMPRREGL